MNLIKQYAGVVALVILAIVAIVQHLPKDTSFGTAVDCGANTCLSGGLGLTTGPLQVDGNTILNGNLALTGTPTITGNLTVTGTTTSKGLSLSGRPAIVVTNAAFCINVFATSTGTQGNVTFAASTTAPTNGSGVIAVFAYGACS